MSVVNTENMRKCRGCPDYQAQAMTDILGKPVRVIAFSTPEEVTILWPSGQAVGKD